jgi:uncharacterized protein
MSAAPTPVHEPSSPPDAGAPAGDSGRVPSAAATAVFHVERLPISGWGLEASSGARRAGGIARPASLGAGGLIQIQEGGAGGIGVPAAAGSVQPIQPAAGMTPARAAPSAGQFANEHASEVRGWSQGASRGPGWRRVFAWPLLALLWIYRKLVSPVLPPACRYYPSCSQYAVEAVTLHGPIRGVWLSARRLLRCHPWAPGGPDPVPPPQRPDPGRVP